MSAARLSQRHADLQAKLDAAKGRAWCDHAFYIGGSAVNAEQLLELENLPGCAGVEVFMGSSFGDLLADDTEVRAQVVVHEETLVGQPQGQPLDFLEIRRDL